MHPLDVLVAHSMAQFVSQSEPLLRQQEPLRNCHNFAIVVNLSGCLTSHTVGPKLSKRIHGLNAVPQRRQCNRRLKHFNFVYRRAAIPKLIPAIPNISLEMPDRYVDPREPATAVVRRMCRYRHDSSGPMGWLGQSLDPWPTSTALRVPAIQARRAAVHDDDGAGVALVAQGGAGREGAVAVAGLGFRLARGFGAGDVVAYFSVFF